MLNKEESLIIDKVFENITIQDILSMNDSLGFKCMFSISSNIFRIVHCPAAIIKNKYKQIDYQVTDSYLKNIKLMKKIQSIYGMCQYLEVSNKRELYNSSILEYDKKSKKVIYRESYTYKGIISDDVYFLTTNDADFFNDLDEDMTKLLVKKHFDKKFSELNKKEMEILKMYYM